MKEIAEILYHFFSLFNVLVAGIVIGLILARHERKSEHAEKSASSAPTFVIFELCGALSSRSDAAPTEPGKDIPGNRNRGSNQGDAPDNDRQN